MGCMVFLWDHENNTLSASSPSANVFDNIRCSVLPLAAQLSGHKALWHSFQSITKRVENSHLKNSSN